MELGKEAWDKSSSYYDQLCFEQDGDRVEKFAAKNFALHKKMPSQELFWKHHIAPCTGRPGPFFMRDGADETAKKICQLSYSVFSDILEALHQMEMIKYDGLGLRNRNAIIVITFAGNALIKFRDLQKVLADDLSQKLGAQITLPSRDENSDWAKQRAKVAAYRNYLTHSGLFLTRKSTTSGNDLVLKPEKIKKSSWASLSEAEQIRNSPQEDWQELDEACQETVERTLALLNEGYTEIVAQMKNLLTNANYQRLWGWDETTAVAIPKPMTPVSVTGQMIPPQLMPRSYSSTEVPPSGAV